MRLKRDFYNRNTLIVAKQLLGKVLVRKIGNKIIRAEIIETEAYCGPNDLACHASKGRTKRTEIMFGQPGHAYVYMIYGMYHCLNIVTEKENYPAAVLIRGVERIIGPGKICRELKIDKNLNGVDIIKSKKLWIEKGDSKSIKIQKTKRIGVDYAKEYKDKLWRFILQK